MNPFFSDWYHSTGVEVSDEELRKRWQAVETFSKKLKIDHALSLVRLFNDTLSTGDGFREQFGTSVQKADATFRFRNNDHEMMIMAGAVIAESLRSKGSSTVNDVASLAMVSANFRAVSSTIAPMQQDLIAASKAYLIKESVLVRSPDSLTFSAEESEKITNAVEKFKEAFTQPPLVSAKDVLAAPFEVLQNEITRQSSSVKKLEHAVNIQREESNMAWWAIGEYSRDLEKPIRNYTLSEFCLIAGKELADLTLLMPGPRSAPALLDKVLRLAVQEPASDISLAEAVNKAPKDWRENWLLNGQIDKVIDFCPVHHAAQKSIEADDWVSTFASKTGIDATQRFTPFKLALQTYGEALLVQAAKE